MKIMLYAIFFQILLVTGAVFGQYQLPFGFEKSYDLPVFNQQQTELANPWGGGLYAVQFNAIDLDSDGIKDLVVFDRYGNRTLTWKNLGLTGEVSYHFAPELATQLPRFSDWVIFTDYNGDGLEDIFTYSPGFAGIKVFRNNGPQAAEQFELVVPQYLTSFQGNGYVNILVTYVDYPAIIDMDGDGDLDILTFWGLGSFVELHTNESMELYGVPDSLIFRKTSNCWGRFAESEESNLIYLDTCFNFSENQTNGQHQMSSVRNYFRHTGSTFMVFDENGDGLDDLLLGDVDYPSAALLINAGSSGEAVMGSYSYTWPAYDVQVDLWSFPLLNRIDLNNDGRKDLVATVFDPSLVKSQNFENIWYYEDVSSSEAPEFRLRTKSLLQDEMLDFGAGAVPLFFDYNLDGLTDILMGNFGYLDTCFYGTGFNLNCQYRGQLALLENTGTTANPQFRLVDANFADLPSWFPKGEKPYAIVPAAADLDGDGDQDLLLGNALGTLILMENIAQPGQPAEFELKETNYQNVNVGSYSAPQLFDLTHDGLPDLIIGKRNGTITWYENTGSLSGPVFSFVKDSLGGVNVRNPNLSVYGYCNPHFFRDKNGKTHLFAGSEFGEIFYYSGIDDNLDGQFDLVMKNYLWIDEGWRSAVAVAHLNGDEFEDMVVGNYSGGLSWFKGTLPPPEGLVDFSVPKIDLKIFPNPADKFFTLITEETQGIRIEHLRLFDYTGREVKINSNHEGAQVYVYLGVVPAGIYLLLVDLYHPQYKYVTQSSKLIIQ